MGIKAAFHGGRSDDAPPVLAGKGGKGEAEYPIGLRV